MNQLDQYCCGYPNYQYCCNAQFVFIKDYIFSFIYLFIYFNREFGETRRGYFADHVFIDDQRFRKQSNYPLSTKKILTIILPVAGFIVLTGIIVLVFLYYKKFRKEQNRTRKPAGAIRLEDNYSGKNLLMILLKIKFFFTFSCSSRSTN
jgi:hypothetical protein